MLVIPGTAVVVNNIFDGIKNIHSFICIDIMKYIFDSHFIEMF